MEIQSSVNPYYQEAERQSILVNDVRGNLSNAVVASNDINKNSTQQHRQENPETCIPFARLDLDELPHPDNYLPETVDFPSSPSAMMKYRAPGKEGENCDQDVPWSQHKGVDTNIDSGDDDSFHAVIDVEIPHVQLSKGRSEMVPRAQPETVRKRIAVIDDWSYVDIDEDSDTECDVAVQPCATASVNEDSPAPQIQERETPLEADLSIQMSNIGWEKNSADANRASDKPIKTLSEGGYVGTGMKPDLIPETSIHEELDEEHKWRSVVISGLERKIDMKVIEPYKKVLSHGGYQGNDSQTAIIVFSACFLPDRNRVDYTYVMENLFLYVLTTLDQLVAEDYVLVYFHGGTPKNCIPRFSWVKNCYQMIDRRLRKNLKRLYLVHPTLWLKAAVLMCRPFISAKFSRKIVYMPSLTSLSSELPMDNVCIPDRVKQLEFNMMIETIKRQKGLR